MGLKRRTTAPEPVQTPRRYFHAQVYGGERVKQRGEWQATVKNSGLYTFKESKQEERNDIQHS